jgi:hypothetical protein
LTRYFFIVQTPTQRCDDEAGMLLPDDQSAFARALELMRELKRDEQSGDCRDWVMVVQDASGRLVSSIPF